MTMNLTDRYIFSRVVNLSKTRLDCTASTESYPIFEEKRATKLQRATAKKDGVNVGDLIAYFIDVPGRFGGDVHRKAKKSFAVKDKTVTSIFKPYPNSRFAYGDVEGTADALLFVFHDLVVVDGTVQSGSLEVFVARGLKKNSKTLCLLACDGGLDDEMDELRSKSTPAPCYCGRCLAGQDAFK